MTSSNTKPSISPSNPNFSSGPCSKRPGWSLENLNLSCLGRSHRSSEAKKRIQYFIDLSRKILQIPDDYLIGIIPGSDTGAVESAIWNFLGTERNIDVYSWESFGQDWVNDIVKELQLPNIAVHTAEYGKLPDLQPTKTNDVVFLYNGTTSGVKVPNLDWILDDREGITICDATSALFANNIDWSKLDITTYSWQKVMGSEAAHGVMILSPKAVKRFNDFPPTRPIPKLLNLKKGNKLNTGIFEGNTINTPSILCIEDAIDSLQWIESIGGLSNAIERSNRNLDTIINWLENSSGYELLPQSKEIASNTSVCISLKQTDKNLDYNAIAKKIVSILNQEAVAYDIGAYRTAPAGIRIWCGVTISHEDIEKLLPWLDWALNKVVAEG